MKINHKTCFLALIFLCLSFVAAVHAAGINSCESDALCGPRCLLAVCQRYGVEASLEELSSACGIGGESDAKGTSMFALANAAKAKGLETAAMKIGLDELGTGRCEFVGSQGTYNEIKISEK